MNKVCCGVCFFSRGREGGGGKYVVVTHRFYGRAERFRHRGIGIGVYD